MCFIQNLGSSVIIDHCFQSYYSTYRKIYHNVLYRNCWPRLSWLTFGYVCDLNDWAKNNLRRSVREHWVLWFETNAIRKKPMNNTVWNEFSQTYTAVLFARTAILARRWIRKKKKIVRRTKPVAVILCGVTRLNVFMLECVPRKSIRVCILSPFFFIDETVVNRWT